MPGWLIIAAGLALASLAGCSREPATAAATPSATATPGWSARELRQLDSLRLAHLPPPPPSPGNRHADSPVARQFGEQLFHDPRLSANGKLSCAVCHRPAHGFSDGRPRARGLADLPRHTPGLIGSAWSPWQFWDGRSDSLWAQAVQPLRDPREQGVSPARLLQVLTRHYRQPYEQLFGPLPDTPGDGTLLYANAGKALEAFQRTLRPTATRFDRYLEQIAGGRPGLALSTREQDGLRLFMGRGQCLRCHLGPLLSNHGFHNTGLSSRNQGQPDTGRDAGLALLLADPLNCRGALHDAQPADCAHLRHLRRYAPEWLGAFKVPSLRGVGARAPYMHDGRFATLEEVVQHYVRAPNPDGDYGHTELRPLTLTADEQQALADFLKTL